jgi:hypothetical protein
MGYQSGTLVTQFWFIHGNSVFIHLMDSALAGAYPVHNLDCPSFTQEVYCLVLCGRLFYISLGKGIFFIPMGLSLK